jgi:hypothetical protein
MMKLDVCFFTSFNAARPPVPAPTIATSYELFIAASPAIYGVEPEWLAKWTSKVGRVKT